MFPLLALLLQTAAAPADPLVIPVEEGWSPVGVVIVDELPPASHPVKHVLDAADREQILEFHARPGSLERNLFEAEWDGFQAPVTFRVNTTSEGRVEAQARYRHSTCVGAGTAIDLTGELRLQRRTAESDAPLRIAFALIGVEESDWGETEPFQVQGAFEVPTAELGGPWAVDRPALTLEGAREVHLIRPDGRVRARGLLDAALLRQGTWETFYPGGTLHTRIEYVGGVPHGHREAFRPDGTRRDDERVERFRKTR